MDRMDRDADVVSVGSSGLPRWLIATGLLAAAVLLVVALHDRGEPRSPAVVPASSTPCPPLGSTQLPAVPDPVAGLLVEGPGGEPHRDLNQERCDRTAVDGPWTVVVRRPEGSLGRHGAVVTFPVAAPAPGRGVPVGGVPGTAGSGEITWPVAGAYARIRGDLDEATLIAIAARTTVAAGRPVVDPPAPHAVVSSGPYRAPAVHEVGYGSAEVGERAALGGGWIHTGITSGGGFEDRLFAARCVSGGAVHGRPSVVSGIRGGDGMLAWEPAPGLVALVGYGYGEQLDDDAVAALRRVAARTRPITGTEWQATGPVVVHQRNDPLHPGPWPVEAHGAPGS
jgi:hypothetical protein